MSAHSACRLPSSYLPLVSQDITAGRPSAGQGQPSCAVERLTSAMSVCVWPRSGSERRGRPGFSEIPPFMGQGARGPRLGDWQWQQQQQHRGIRRAAAAMVGHGTWGIAIAKGEREGPGLVRCTRRLARWWDERTRTGCPSIAIKDCANRTTIFWVR